MGLQDTGLFSSGGIWYSAQRPCPYEITAAQAVRSSVGWLGTLPIYVSYISVGTYQYLTILVTFASFIVVQSSITFRAIPTRNTLFILIKTKSGLACTIYWYTCILSDHKTLLDRTEKAFDNTVLNRTVRDID
jgi:hypothetical protein